MCFCRRCNKRRRQTGPALDRDCGPEPTMGADDCGPDVAVKEFDCGKTQQVVQHQHIVRHQHDVINEYDVIHEHEYNYYDVVREREVVRRNDFTSHVPDYCDRPKNNNCGCRQRRRRFFC